MKKTIAMYDKLFLTMSALCYFRCNTHKRMLRLAAVIALFTVGMVIINVTNINIFQDLFEKVPQETVKSLQQRKNNHSRPNILLIVADDLGFNDVGYHGSGIKTPNLDHLARSGVRLENYYVQQVCTPTRGQLLSGRHEVCGYCSNSVTAFLHFG